MIVVTGGIASGKKTYLRNRGISLEAAFDARQHRENLGACEASEGVRALVGAFMESNAHVVLHAEELVRFDALPADAIDKLCRLHALTCTEVGSGVIPLTWEERQFRERAGSLAAALAQQAECVVRMVCGIPLVLKEADSAHA